MFFYFPLDKKLKKTFTTQISYLTYMGTIKLKNKKRNAIMLCANNIFMDNGLYNQIIPIQ